MKDIEWRDSSVEIKFGSPKLPQKQKQRTNDVPYGENEVDGLDVGVVKHKGEPNTGADGHNKVAKPVKNIKDAPNNGGDGGNGNKVAKPKQRAPEHGGEGHANAAKVVPDKPNKVVPDKPNKVAKGFKKDKPVKTPVCLTRTILVLIDLKIHNRFHFVWDYVSTHPDAENDILYRGKVQCPTKQGCNDTAELTFTTNYTRHMKDKDAVVINMVPIATYANAEELWKYIDVPQLRIFFSQEGPAKNYNDFFRYNIQNLPVHGIWSYNSKSEMYRGYGSWEPEPTRKSWWDGIRKLENKNKLVAWMASNCDHTYWPRYRFALELQRNVAVDIYGKCGEKECPRKADQCYKLIATYKFYLSLENVECDDYITEKLWKNALLNGVVPIVYGPRKKDYERFLPPNSFIYAGDFDSAKSLADYIKKLDTHPALYKKYFEWYGTITPSQAIHLDSFCEMLPLIDQHKSRKIESKPLHTFPWWAACKTDPANATLTNDYHKWKPW